MFKEQKGKSNEIQEVDSYCYNTILKDVPLRDMFKKAFPKNGN